MEAGSLSKMLMRERLLPVWKGGLIVLLVILAYFPALHGDFLWDDDTYISANNTLRSLASFQDIWAKLGATEQYYPLTFTLFWIGYHLWGLNPFGYHLLTLSLHCVTSLLLWQVLVRLRVRGAFLAGAIFALHPVCVMSVAWMTELKNTLSGALALAAGWAYLRFAGLGVYEGGNGSEKKVVQVDWRFYALALGFFQLALLAKTAVSFLPVTLFLILWWQRERLCWRDLWPLLPMLGMAMVMGQVTSYVEQHSGGASGAQFNIGLPERVLISGRSFWFYLGKIFIPWQLTFIYPRWQMNAGAWWQYLYPAATLGLLWGLWKMRRRFGKGPFAAMLHFYISTSFLILILVLYMTRYSFVSDHWQYFGCMSVMALAAAGISRVLSPFEERSPFLKPALYGTLLLTLGVLSWRQAEIYRDNETLWHDTLSKNPECWLAHNNLGIYLYREGHLAEAIEHYHKAIQINPDRYDAYYSLGAALADEGRWDEAIENYRKAIQLYPNYAYAFNNLGNALAATGQLDGAVRSYRRAVQIAPTYSTALNNLGVLLAAQGQFHEAIQSYHRAIQSNPKNSDPHVNLGITFGQLGRTREAVVQYREALKLDPDLTTALNNLAWALATSSDDQLRNGDEAIRLAEHACELTRYTQPWFVGTLAAAYAEAGRFPEAITTAEKAVQLATTAGNQQLAAENRRLLELYRASKPYHEPSPTQP